jgi:hypothetical protein
VRRIVLYLEDGSALRTSTASRLKEDYGYNVEEFSRIDVAIEFLEDIENINEIVCIITDLNMSDEWLGDYQHESDGAVLSGWVWLQRFVYLKKDNIPTVIYSKFVTYLENELEKKGAISNSNLRNKKHIELVGKGANKNEGFEGLLKALDKLKIKP